MCVCAGGGDDYSREAIIISTKGEQSIEGRLVFEEIAVILVDRRRKF